MPVLHVLRVFCDSDGQFGSPLGVILDGPAVPPERRQPLAAELGLTETVYVDTRTPASCGSSPRPPSCPSRDTRSSAPLGSSATTSADR